jgi:hypothetical protein
MPRRRSGRTDRLRAEVHRPEAHRNEKLVVPLNLHDIRPDAALAGRGMPVGFGLLGGALTVLAVATPVPVSGLMITVTALSIVALAIRRQIPGGIEKLTRGFFDFDS